MNVTLRLCQTVSVVRATNSKKFSTAFTYSFNYSSLFQICLSEMQLFPNLIQLLSLVPTCFHLVTGTLIVTMLVLQCVIFKLHSLHNSSFYWRQRHFYLLSLCAVLILQLCHFQTCHFRHDNSNPISKSTLQLNPIVIRMQGAQVRENATKSQITFKHSGLHEEGRPIHPFLYSIL